MRSDPPARRAQLVATAGAVSAAAGAAVLFGWWRDVEPLKTALLFGAATMKPNAAFCFLLLGVALWLEQRASSRLRVVARICAAVVSIVALATLVEYVSGANLHIDELLFTDPQVHVANAPGRMSWIGALGLFLISLAFLFPAPRGADLGIRSLLTPAAVLVSWLGLTSYFYGFEHRFSAPVFTRVALHTAGLLVMLSVALFVMRREDPLTHLILGRSASARFARRLLPAAFLVPIVLGYVMLVAVRRGFPADEAELFEVVGNVLLFVLLILWSTASLGTFEQRTARADEQRRQALLDLERSNQDLEQFAAVASHDLQEPLRKIQMFGQLLREATQGGLSPDARTYLDRMEVAAARGQELVRGLLSYSRVTTRGQPAEPVDLAVCAREVLDDLEATIAKTNAKIVLGSLPVVAGDPLQLRQVLQNLIGNALKFHRPGQAPMVRVHAEPQQGTWKITISDDGIGFDERYLDRIFRLFQRLHERGKYEGAGLGLAICKKIVERHGGTITAHSVPGQGSEFTVVLPEMVRSAGSAE